MTNNAWNRLCNEWKANSAVNEYFTELCKAKGVDAYFVNALQTETCLEIRKLCKANYIWLENFEEADEYLERKPFGRDYTQTELEPLITQFKIVRRQRKARTS